MQIPSQLLEFLKAIKGFERKAFEEVHSSGEQVTSIRINPLKHFTFESRLISGPNSQIPWTQYGYYLAERPSFTFDPLFHAGCYYVQEASSMFLEQALKQSVDLSKPLKVLDLCAAPGGKSTHIQSLISNESLLVSNEVIRSRANILKDNIVKWGCQNVVVTNNDPKEIGRLENYFDVIVVDAPCSGSGLFRRDPDAIDEWSENNVQLCSQRQQRILADIYPALKKDGILIYSTCSYSKEEDEDIFDWLLQEFSLIPIPLTVQSSWGIDDTGKGYRFWPDKVKGEGFFLASFQKQEGEENASTKYKAKPATTNKRESVIVANWVTGSDHVFVKNNSTVYSWPLNCANDFSLLLEKLKVVYSGTLIGDLIRDKLVPDHALAMSNIVAGTIERIELSREVAIKYLQRKDIEIQGTNKGWRLISFDGHALGWVNILPNRVNNYYPKELRILKEN